MITSIIVIIIIITIHDHHYHFLLLLLLISSDVTTLTTLTIIITAASFLIFVTHHLPPPPTHLPSLAHLTRRSPRHPRPEPHHSTSSFNPNLPSSPPFVLVLLPHQPHRSPPRPAALPPRRQEPGAQPPTLALPRGMHAASLHKYDLESKLTFIL